jgi:putative membrane protein
MRLGGASTAAERFHGRLAPMGFLVRVLASAVAIWAAAAIVPGVEIGGPEFTDQALVAVLVGLIFGIVNAVIKPIVAVLAFPLYVVTLGLFTFIANALLFWLTAWLAGLFNLDFTVEGFGAAFFGALVVTIVSWALSLVVRE